MTDNAPKYGRLFREAVAESVRDYIRERGLLREGHWIIRLNKRAPLVPARTWLSPHEPGEPDNLLDTGPVWMAEIAGEPADPIEVFAATERQAITKEDYAYRTADQAWAREHAPTEAQAQPRKGVNFSTHPPPF